MGTLYGLTGTLNMADMAQKIAMADAERAPLLAAAGLLLLVVFALKAALLPLYFWLPRAYAAASAPVAALFAIMTKVGIYSILRVYTLVFGDAAGELANLAQAWLWPLALATLGLGAIGALAARTLQGLLAYLVVVSAGTLLAGVALGSERALAASLYYLLHSTWIAGGLFLLADLVARQRGDKAGDLVQGPALQNPRLLGGAFFIGAIAVAGLPPLSGFFGKIIVRVHCEMADVAAEAQLRIAHVLHKTRSVHIADLGDIAVDAARIGIGLGEPGQRSFVPVGEEGRTRRETVVERREGGCADCTNSCIELALGHGGRGRLGDRTVCLFGLGRRHNLDRRVGRVSRDVGVGGIGRVAATWPVECGCLIVNLIGTCDDLGCPHGVIGCLERDDADAKQCEHGSRSSQWPQATRWLRWLG